MAEKTVPAKVAKQEVPATREEERYLRPPVDIYEEDDKLVVVCDIPGVTKDDVKLDVNENILTIEGKVKHEPVADMSYEEFSLANYFRQFEISEGIDQSRISAELKNGVLTIDLPKVEKAKPRKIPVKTA